MAVPSSAQLATTDNYISSTDLHKPEIDSEYVERYVDELLLLDFAEMLGNKKPVAQTSFKHFEAPRLMSYITSFTDYADPTADTSLTVRLAADNHLNFGKSSFPRVKDLVQMPNGVTGQIIAKSEAVDNAHTVTIHPLLASQSLGAVTTGQTIIVYSNAHAPGTGSPAGRTWTALSYTNQCQIIKEAFEVEGSEMTNQVWVEVPDENGNLGYVWYYEGENNTFRMLRVQMEFNHVITPQADSATITADGTRTTEGMIPFIETRGGIVESYSQGQVNLARHKSLVKRLDKNGTYAKEYGFFLGIDLYDEYENFMLDLGKNGGISYASFSGGQDQAIHLGFSSIYTLGYTFHFKNYRMFNDASSLGAPGMQYPGYGIGMPMGTTVHAKSGKRVPYFRVRPKQAAGYDRYLESWPTGGAGNIRKTNDIDKLTMNYRGEYGTEYFVPPQWFLFKRV